jgi:hypothetical protein
VLKFSSARSLAIDELSHFDRVALQEPLKKNFSGLPEHLSHLADSLGLITIIGENGPRPGTLARDMFVFGYKEFLDPVTETKLLPSALEHFSYPDHQPPYESVLAEVPSLHSVFFKKRFIMEGSTMVISEEEAGDYANKPDKKSEWESVEVNTPFYLPDGSIGLITVTNMPYHRYGWGACGSCIDIRYQIKRIPKSGGEEDLGFFIKENGLNQVLASPYFRNFRLADVYSFNWGWIQKGKSFEITALGYLSYDHDTRQREADEPDEYLRVVLEWDPLLENFKFSPAKKGSQRSKK